MVQIPQPLPDSMDDKKSVRDFLLKALKRDIVGPSWLDEVGNENPNELLKIKKQTPTMYYYCGYILPRKQEHFDSTSDDSGLIDAISLSESTAPPERISGENNKSGDMSDERILNSKISDENMALPPRSVGLTVRPSDLENHPAELLVSWGEYELLGQEGDENLWQRHPHVFSMMIEMSQFDGQKEARINLPDYNGLEIYMRLGDSEQPTLTIRLVNNRENIGGLAKAAELAVYQPELRVKSQFTEIRNQNMQDNDSSMALLYSESEIIAKGHNIGVNWSENEAWTDHLPSFEVPLMREVESLYQIIPEMELLADDSTVNDGINLLERLIDEYQNWIKVQDLNFLDKDDNYQTTHQEAYDEHKKRVSTTVSRIKSGIDYLRNDDDVRKAFVLANRAIMKSQKDPTLDPTVAIPEFKWRPFQICFQLLNIRGLLESDSNEKEIVDLAWFPTGGGKTEAYLGLIAISSFHRRISQNTIIQEKAAPGIHSIMRYTLRLLTSDQAGRLVRACGAMNLVADEEGIGQHDGFMPFRVGMWIGREASPNDFFPRGDWSQQNSAQSIIDAAKGMEETGEDCTVAQFPTCPWCGDESVGNAANYEISVQPWSRNKPVLYVACKNSACPFSAGVPFTCVDEDIYLNPPSILLGTADKFAQLAYNHRPKTILEIDDYANVEVEKLDARNMMGFAQSDGGPAPPSLIIQDELHLLTGPLGTIAGLVECSLDVLWKEVCNGHRVKYVAATATIRGAENDASLMYGRDLNIFPPPLITIKDNFFAKEIPVTEKDGRIHIGLLSPYGKSRTLMVRPTASLLQNSNIIDKSNISTDNDLDPYWTLVLYYNSLRELGGGQSDLRKNIPQSIQLISNITDTDSRNLALEVELTSRKTADQLRDAKKAMENSLGKDDEIVDVVSTSNMFQVGIDIGRLGLMGIVGQPKSNSEYIQSSGRVGRKYPGLVISYLKGNYPRDQSHYEHFRAFHQEIYAHVDQTSITPFSTRALDRAFPSTMMLLFRLGIKKLKEAQTLKHLSLNDVKRSCDGLIDSFVKEIERRQRDREISEVLISEGIDIIHSKYDRLKHFVEHAKKKESTAWWIIWNHAQRNEHEKENPLSYLSSQFRVSTNTMNEDFETGLGSFRDVAQEAEFAFVTQKQGVYSRSESLPESHFFSHTAPGFVWEKGGSSFMTTGISLWNNNTIDSQGQTYSLGAFKSKSDQFVSGGTRIDEPSLSTILGKNSDGSQKFLRELPKFSDGKKQQGNITVKNYPETVICSKGHIGFAKWNAEKQEFRCGRDGCDEEVTRSKWVSVCENGHIEDFNYRRWAHVDRVHESDDWGNHRVKLVEGESSGLTLSDWVVVCEDCGDSKNMQQVPWVSSEDKKHAPKCNGRRTWLSGDNSATEECDQRMVHRQVGNISVSFTEGASVLLIPPDVSLSFANDPIIQRLLKVASDNNHTKAKFKQKLEGYIEDEMYDPSESLGTTNFESPDGDYDIDGFVDLLWEFKDKHFGNNLLTLENLRGRERHGMISDGLAANADKERFDKTTISGNMGNINEDWLEDDWPLRGASRINRLTELKYITGLSRVNHTDGKIQPIDHPETRGNEPKEEFGTGMYNFGEGLYFDIKPEWLVNLANKRNERIEDERHRLMKYVKEERMLNFKKQVTALNYDVNNSAFTILHTFSHMLIRELANLSGFSLGSIRERLYFDANEAGDISHCGILLYTSGSSSDGTLGGLVRRGSSVRKVNDLIRNALTNITECSNDPVCQDHVPNSDEPNGAACHSCVLLPETSCELGNYFLDRNWGF